MTTATHETTRPLGPEQNLLFADFAVQLGGLAMDQVHAGVEADFSPLQANIIRGLADGNTTNQISGHLGIPAKFIKDTKRDITRQFSCVSVGVNFAINRGVVKFKLQPNPDITSRLTALDLGFLHSYATGQVSSYSRAISDGNYKTVKDCEAELFKKIHAFNRPHAVKRTYELGIFSTIKGEQL